METGSTKCYPASGCLVKRCRGCLYVNHCTKRTIANGLRVIRIRFRLPYSEFPDPVVGDLSRPLLFLLGEGRARPTFSFPRRQGTTDPISGLCSVIRLDRRSRWSFAQSVSSLKRSLPAGCRHCTPSERGTWESRALNPNPTPPTDEYVSFAREETARIFSKGWDRRYRSSVMSFVPNASSRACGGRADLLWSGNREEFVNWCLHSKTPVPSFEGRYKEVLSAGKVRPLVIYSSAVDLLGPLHSAVYGHLQKKDWLLSGPPTAERISHHCLGGINLSVDLVSATDNLDLGVSLAVLNVLLSQSSNVPEGVKESARRSLHPFVGGRPILHGQMMGSYLSFPLLCLHSYIAARWATRFVKAEYLVNGDDCVIFSAGNEVLDYPPGYILNTSKSIRSRSVVEVNSTTFLLSGGKWREVRHLRRGGADDSYQGARHLAAACSQSVWQTAYVRSRVHRRWGFTPEQLGLDLRIQPVFERSRSMAHHRIHTGLPVLDPVVQVGLVCLPGKPASDEIEALTDFLFLNGRHCSGVRKEKPVTVGSLRRTYSYRSTIRKAGVIWPGQFLSRPFGTKVPGRDVYFAPEEYTSVEERKRCEDAEFELDFLWGSRS